jgi:hypothetical protein
VAIIPVQAWSSHLGPRRSTLGCGPSSRVSVPLWAAPAGTRLVAKAQREPVKELLVLAGTGNLTPQRLPEILRFSHCPKS